MSVIKMVSDSCKIRKFLDRKILNNRRAKGRQKLSA
jgi:hypothetical protein